MKKDPAKTQRIVFFKPSTEFQQMPLAQNGVSAGFPSPADDFKESQDMSYVIDFKRTSDKGPVPVMHNLWEEQTLERASGSVSVLLHAYACKIFM